MTHIKILPRMGITAFKPKDTRCKVPISAITENMGRGRNKKLGAKCACFAKLVINGTPMCLRHAQQEALNILLKEMK